MRSHQVKLAVGVLGIALFLLAWGCDGPKPLSPAQNVSVAVSLSPSKDVQASLLGSSSNILLWSYQTGSSAGVHGQAGPFNSSSATGNLAFTLTLPIGGKNILSVQLNDGTTNQPIAVGAVPIDLTNPSANMGVSLQLGSVIRQCYVLGNAVPGNYYDLYDHLIYTYSSAIPIPADMEIFPGNVNYQLQDLNGNSNIAYLGNGNLVNYDYVPATSSFFPNSGQSKNQVLGLTSTPASAGVTVDMAAGDIYCVKLTTAPGEFAWMQVTNPGSGQNGTYPSFLFRISPNSYYSYFQSAADVAGNGACGTWYYSTTSAPVTTNTSPVSTGTFPGGGGAPT